MSYLVQYLDEPERTVERVDEFITAKQKDKRIKGKQNKEPLEC
jgi:hypothetical protein